MTNYLEILRLNSLGISKSAIAENLGCSRTTDLMIASLLKQSEIIYVSSNFLFIFYTIQSFLCPTKKTYET